MEGPHSSYSCLEIHICWKVDREARMDPPIQTEYLQMSNVRIIKSDIIAGKGELGFNKNCLILVNIIYLLSLWWGNCLDLHG